MTILCLARLSQCHEHAGERHVLTRQQPEGCVQHLDALGKVANAEALLPMVHLALQCAIHRRSDRRCVVSPGYLKAQCRNTQEGFARDGADVRGPMPRVGESLNLPVSRTSHQPAASMGFRGGRG